MKLSKSERAALAQHQATLREDRETIDVAFGVAMEQVNEALAVVNRAIASHNDNVGVARIFVKGIADRLRDEYDNKSERWQESDAGQAAGDMASEWEDANLLDVEPVRIVRPDKPFYEESLNLPEEAE